MRTNRLARRLLPVALLALTGCVDPLTALSRGAGRIDTLPEILARRRWVGRPVEAAHMHWGTPTESGRDADGRTVDVWLWDTSDIVTDAAGSDVRMTPTGIVRTDYYRDRVRRRGCMLVLTSRDGIVTGFELQGGSLGGCAGVD